MKALVATGYGHPAQLLAVIDLPVPQPGPGQILVKIAASTINATDLRVVTGAFGAALQLDFPYTLGNDFAGAVVEVGPEVSQYAVGDEVFGQAVPRALRAVAATTRPSLTTGAMAEYAVFEADTPLLALRPENVTAEQAAALAIGGMTAQAALAVARVEAGQTALVIGATGGVGTALVPLLAAAGVQVVGTAGTAADAEALQELGAGQVVPFDAVHYPVDVDVVFNLFLTGDQIAPAAAAVRRGGRLVSIVFPPPTPQELGREDVDLHVVMDLEGRHGGMQGVADAAAKGDLLAVLGRRYALSQGVQAAVEYADVNPMGKIVVTM